jgi:succinyl-CoA synthetase alpha subunit
MSIIVGNDTKVIVHGITGNEGMFHAQAMLRYGTKIVAGVTPGKGGQTAAGVPVYNNAAEAVARHGANTSIIFVPARFARDAAMDALNAGIKVLVIITEHIPQKDTIELIAVASRKGVVIIGPNCPGIINPSTKAHIGIMPSHIFKPGKSVLYREAAP